MNYPIRLAAILFATGALTSQGAEILKANNADNLNLTSSWQGGAVPGPSDIGAWTNNSGSSAVNLGADLSWYGVKVYTPGATPQINSGNKLTLGAGGIVLGGNNFAVNSSLILSASQNWNLGTKALFVRGPVFGTNVTINITGSAYLDFTSSASGLSGTINYGLPSRFRVAGFAGTNVAVNIQSGASFDAYGYIGTTVVGDLITANPKATLGGSDQNGTVTYEIGALGNDSTWAGRILNGGSGTTRTSIRKVGSGTWTLAGTNTYSGTTTIDGGTLALSGIGTISNTTLISIGGGATFDVSGLNSTFTLGSTQTLASSESATANLRGDLDLTAGAIDVSAYVAGTPAFNLGGGTLVLSSNTVFDLFNVGSALTAGSYKIISTNAGGAVTGTLPLVNVDAGGFASGTSWSLVISNAELYLWVQNTADLTLASSKNPSSFQESVTFTAALPADATGSVIFSTFNVPISTNAVIGGIATSAAVNWLAGGTNYIIATYSGDANYPQSTRTLVQRVTNAPTIYATWCMNWIDSNASWWNPTNYQGATDFMGIYGSIDWANTNYVISTLDTVKENGVDTIICDLTNGWGWLNNLVQYIQQLALGKGMKVCVAENSSGNLASFEQHCADIWRLFAGPTAPYRSTYLMKDGKPVLVCYSVQSWFNAYVASTGPNRQHFTLVRAGSQSVDNWGTQYDPSVGPGGSADSVYVTPSIKYAPSSVSIYFWRKSQAWLDYAFKIAKESKPRFTIVGCYDDVHERNCWIQADTTGSILGMQMRDMTGAISTTNYVNRVREWILGTPSVVPGGAIPDGCYVVTNSTTGLCLNMPNNVGTNLGQAGLQLKLDVPSASLNNYFSFYHLGANVYRITSLNSGCFLSATNSTSGLPIVQDWNSTDPAQRWTVLSGANGALIFQNMATGQVLDLGGTSAGSLVVQKPRDVAAASQQWTLGTVLQIAPAMPPLLTVQQVGNAVQLSWPAEYSNYILQKQSGPLNPADAAWQNVTGVVANSYSEPATNSSVFFRLKSP